MMMLGERKCVFVMERKGECVRVRVRACVCVFVHQCFEANVYERARQAI